jgi:hypothetical protein
MKKILSFLFSLIIGNCYSATGNASDGEIGALVILVIIALIVATGYFIDFLKRIFKNSTIKRVFHIRKTDEEGDLGNTYFDENISLSQVIPE